MKPQLIKITDYLRDHRYDLVLLLLLANDGDYEPLRNAIPEKEGWNLLQEARGYGMLTKLHAPADFPIALSSEGLLTKKIFRLAGLLMSSQESFMAVPTSLPGLKPETFKLSKEDQKKVDDFYSALINPLKSDQPKNEVSSPPPPSSSADSDS